MISATGGFIEFKSIDGITYTVHTFTSSGVFQVIEEGNVDYMVIAGGGGSGDNGGGGGGAGGVRLGTTSLTPGNYTVIVGTGGPRAVTATFAASSGTNSTFHTFTAIGGGGGASRDGGGGGQTGGSGGGGAAAAASPQQLSGSGTTGQGFAGGNGTIGTGSTAAGGGGGGFSSSGGVPNGVTGGAGGNGYLNPITELGYAGGGAGSGLDYSNFGGRAGSVQAGFGGGGPQNLSRNGRVNSGGGGGSLANASNSNENGAGNGGSGVVVIYYINTIFRSASSGGLGGPNAGGGGGAGGYFVGGGAGGNGSILSPGQDSIDLLPGNVEYTDPGTYQWICPFGINQVSVVCVGGGGGPAANTSGASGAGGGGLGWKNNIPVVPGRRYTVVVGAGGTRVTAGQAPRGGDSFFIDLSTVAGLGGEGGLAAANGNPSGGGWIGDGGGSGGQGGNRLGTIDGAGGGGGAGGYSGNGGNGGNFNIAGSAGTGGAGGGGGSCGTIDTAGAGGGVGLYGQGANGAGGAGSTTDGHGGFGGSGGQDASNASASTLSNNFFGELTLSRPGNYGGGGAGSDNTSQIEQSAGGNGAVRIIWGPGRVFPDSANFVYNTQGLISDGGGGGGSGSETGGGGGGVGIFGSSTGGQGGSLGQAANLSNGGLYGGGGGGTSFSTVDPSYGNGAHGALAIYWGETIEFPKGELSDNFITESFPDETTQLNIDSTITSVIGTTSINSVETFTPFYVLGNQPILNRKDFFVSNTVNITKQYGSEYVQPENKLLGLTQVISRNELVVSKEIVFGSDISFNQISIFTSNVNDEMMMVNKDPKLLATWDNPTNYQVIEKVTLENDPRRITVRLLNFIVGVTGEGALVPTQVQIWF